MTAEAPAAKRSFNDRMLDTIEKAGNKVPHPVIMFIYLIAGIAVLSAVLAWFDVSVTEECADYFLGRLDSRANGR
jgi:aminobenzoyl-glutamate transport protein